MFLKCAMKLSLVALCAGMSFVIPAKVSATTVTAPPTTTENYALSGTFAANETTSPESAASEKFVLDFSIQSPLTVATTQVNSTVTGYTLNGVKQSGVIGEGITLSQLTTGGFFAKLQSSDGDFFSFGGTVSPSSPAPYTLATPYVILNSGSWSVSGVSFTALNSDPAVSGVTLTATSATPEPAASLLVALGAVLVGCRYVRIKGAAV